MGEYHGRLACHWSTVLLCHHGVRPRSVRPLARPRRINTRMLSILPAGNISSAYRKPHTCWQHHAALTGGVTYSEPARTTTRRVRIRRIRVAGLLVVIAAIAAALRYQSLPSSSSTAASPIDVLRGEHPGAL